MALVPFRTLGPAADQRAEERLFQVGSLAVTIRQQPRAGMQPVPHQGSPQVSLTWAEQEAATPDVSKLPMDGMPAPDAPAFSAQAAGPNPLERLGSVGLVAWQCGFLLAELLLGTQPCGSWPGVRVIDLGCGTGLVGISLALSGASVTLTDLPHVLPLAALNAKVNCERHMVAQEAFPDVKEHAWGDAVTAATLPAQPDLITAADVLYSPEYYGALLESLTLLCSPHTLVYIAWKKRHVDEGAFPGMAEAKGFAVEQVPAECLPEEYRDGGYVVLRLCRLEPMSID